MLLITEATDGLNILAQGVGITGVNELDITFTEDSEVLLFDLGMDAPMIWT